MNKFWRLEKSTIIKTVAERSRLYLKQNLICLEYLVLKWTINKTFSSENLISQSQRFWQIQVNYLNVFHHIRTKRSSSTNRIHYNQIQLCFRCDWWTKATRNIFSFITVNQSIPINSIELFWVVKTIYTRNFCLRHYLCKFERRNNLQWWISFSKNEQGQKIVVIKNSHACHNPELSSELSASWGRLCFQMLSNDQKFLYLKNVL